jgi:hypothetical protein
VSVAKGQVGGATLKSVQVVQDREAIDEGRVEPQPAPYLEETGDGLLNDIIDSVSIDGARGGAEDSTSSTICTDPWLSSSWPARLTGAPPPRHAPLCG